MMTRVGPYGHLGYWGGRGRRSAKARRLSFMTHAVADAYLVHERLMPRQYRAGNLVVSIADLEPHMGQTAVRVIDLAKGPRDDSDYLAYLRRKMRLAARIFLLSWIGASLAAFEVMRFIHTGSSILPITLVIFCLAASLSLTVLALLSFRVSTRYMMTIATRD